MSQIQDIAGCRLIVEDIAAQGSTVELLKNLFENITVVDRRKQPSHGYRAVHVIVNGLGKSIEIQIRTQLQQLWAEFSEKVSDVIDPAIKYGGGDQGIQSILNGSSGMVADYEAYESIVANLVNQIQLLNPAEVSADAVRDVAQETEILENERRILFNTLRDMIDDVPILNELTNELPNELEMEKFSNDISN